MTIILKGGAETLDPRLDRIKQFDERSRNYGIAQTPIAALPQRSKSWDCYLRLDQGREGACVGAGLTHELASYPVRVANLNMQFARGVYYEAQKGDPWAGGEYPGASPIYAGTSILSGLRTLQRMGYCEGYRWSFSLNDLIQGLGYQGPAVIGVDWHEGMQYVDSRGYINVRGSVMGGHCVLVRGVSLYYKRFRIVNSWGADWGRNGECFISFSDMERLLHMEGEAAFLTGRKRPLAA